MSYSNCEYIIYVNFVHNFNFCLVWISKKYLNLQ